VRCRHPLLSEWVRARARKTGKGRQLYGTSRARCSDASCRCHLFNENLHQNNNTNSRLTQNSCVLFWIPSHSPLPQTSPSEAAVRCDAGAFGVRREEFAGELDVLRLNRAADASLRLVSMHVCFSSSVSSFSDEACSCRRIGLLFLYFVCCRARRRRCRSREGDFRPMMPSARPHPLEGPLAL